MTDYRRILLDGGCVQMVRDRDDLVAADGRRAGFGAQPTASEEVISTALGGNWEFRGIRPPARS